MHNISLTFSGFQAPNKVDLTFHGGSVYTLTGTNGAGKSTLMTVLCGTHAHYEDEVAINNQSVTIRSPRDAKQLGVHLMQQEVDMALIPGLSITGDIILGRLTEPDMAFRWSRVQQLAREALAQLGVALNVRRSTDSYTFTEKQQILLVHALSYHYHFLTLDEPAAPLDQHENKRLFVVVRHLQQQGTGVVFISHRIHELKAVCDTLTVLRDGRLIESGPMVPLSDERVVEKMLGRGLSDVFPPPRPPHDEEVLLQIDGLYNEALPQDISLRLQEGEILGIAELTGAGKTELCKVPFGASKSQVQRGELNSRLWRPRDPADSVGHGLVLIPEGRRKEGVFIEGPITMNLAVSADNSFSRWSLSGRQQAWRQAEEVTARLGVCATGPGQMLRRPSGGNQQRVAAGK